MDGDALAQGPAPFKLERFFEKYEFAAPHLLCCSDCEPVMMADLLALADADARERWDNLRLSYTEPSGLTPLRREAAALYGGALTPEQLLVLAPEEGVYLTMRALLRPGDRVVCCYPAYQSLYELAASTGCTVDHWEPEFDPASARARFDVSRLEALIGPSEAGAARPEAGAARSEAGARAPARLVVVNFPHNPTGETITADEQSRIVSACRAAGAHLFSDEMYWQLEPSPAARLPPAAALYEKAVSLCGVSKSWGLPGLRIGWIATRDAALLARVAALKDYTTICSSAPSEVLALIALRATETLTSRARALVAANTALAARFFDRWRALFDWAPPAAGPIAFPRVKLDAARALAAPGSKPIAGVDEFCEAAVEEAGVLLLPGSIYDHGPSSQRGHFRLGLGRKATPAALEAFDAWLRRRFPGALEQA
ncbi:aspartate aminotransferase [Raphidocelis subcapitata]|uniref:Aspartate aminotransferase n=1 Tax=Raphidocelis subcapitata TaxID=307507 RepID=A0A2V0PC06_9CHLO|nr:aspartate aminotransferase [Raphidocelis subcapitata]|eukprot:GBF97388.1 aspartate aminotransferase [Raphidocelis subcapitata]